jgi:hypothetical protein
LTQFGFSLQVLRPFAKHFFRRFKLYFRYAYEKNWSKS